MHRVRALDRGDFDALVALEGTRSGAERALGPYFVRLCCEFFRDTCFVATVDGEIVAYVLCFLQEREAYCTTLAVHPRHRRSEVLQKLLRRVVISLERRVDSCWFTVKQSKQMARLLRDGLGDIDLETRTDFYGPGDDRLVLRIDREALSRQRLRYRTDGTSPHAPRLAPTPHGGLAPC